jgi:hypothetical protein
MSHLMSPVDGGTECAMRSTMGQLDPAEARALSEHGCPAGMEEAFEAR